jgi:hypothetical protein
METLADLKKKSDAQAARMRDAERDFIRLEKEIRPFVRKQRLRKETSAGRWMESSNLTSLDT